MAKFEAPLSPDVMCRLEHEPSSRPKSTGAYPFTGGNVSPALPALRETPGNTPGGGGWFGIMNEIPSGGSSLGCLTLRTRTRRTAVRALAGGSGPAALAISRNNNTTTWGTVSPVHVARPITCPHLRRLAGGIRFGISIGVIGVGRGLAARELLGVRF